MFVPNRKKFSMGMLLGIPASIDNKYVPGSGVGATGVAARRAKYHHATPSKANCTALKTLV